MPDVRIGITSDANFINGSGQVSVAKVGTGQVGVAQARQDSLNNHREDMVVQAGNDVYRASAQTLRVSSGALPAVGDQVTLLVNGQEITGTVRHVDQDNTVAAQQRQAADAARARQTGRAVGAGAAVGLGALLVTGLLVKRTLDQH